METEIKPTGSNAERDLRDIAAETAEDAARKAREAGDTLKDKASDAAHTVKEAGHNIAEKSTHTHQAICDFTKENPTAAVLTAFALGVILSRFLPGR